jgi:endonuclease IV
MTPMNNDEFWHPKSIEQLALEQNVKPIEKWEHIFGKGADLWEDEEDFQSFLKATQGLDSEET